MARPALVLTACMLVPALALAALKDPPVHDKHWPDKYDDHFRKYAKHYFGPGYDWRWFKAQGIAESNLKPAAKSRVGAKGIMQIMPSTFREIKKKNPHFVDITTPKWNIAAGIYYDRQMYNLWKKENEHMTSMQRFTFALGSYNAGFGGMRKAYRKAPASDKPVKEWEEVSPFAPKETRNYVSRIKGLMQTTPPLDNDTPKQQQPEQQPFYYRWFGKPS